MLHRKLRRLDPGQLTVTIKQLCLRIEDRFPESGLAGVCRELLQMAEEAQERVRWIQRPNYWIRYTTYLLVGLILVGTIYSVSQSRLSLGEIGISELIQLATSGLEGLALAAAGLFSLLTIENRVKRTRVIEAVNELRCIAHVIDAHQLTKDPDVIRNRVAPSKHSPKRNMTLPGLGRYLNYCSEMLSLTSKLGFLYVQDFHDPTATETVNDLEDLTNGLARKVWQKIMLTDAVGMNTPPALTPMREETGSGDGGMLTDPLEP